MSLVTFAFKGYGISFGLHSMCICMAYLAASAVSFLILKLGMSFAHQIFAQTLGVKSIIDGYNKLLWSNPFINNVE